MAEALLPIKPSEDTAGIPGNQFIFEPNPARSWSSSCRATWRPALYQAVLELTASE